MLGRKVVPVNFQQRVDELTSYTAKIFQELFSLTNVRDEGDRIVEMDKNVRKEDMAFMYSELHFIISHAAYLAVCIRRSSSIFHFLSGSPAARMSFENEGQACYDLYNLSRVHYEELERAESAKDKQDIHEIETIGGMTPEKIVEAKRAIRIRAHHRTRGARIKFAVWPMITRYKAENIGRPVVRPARFSYFDDPEDRANAPTQNEVEGGEGQRVVEIGKCVVVYYQGIIYPEPGPAGVTFHRDGRHLLPYIASEKPGRDIDIWKGRAKAQFLARILTMALFGILYNHRVQLRESSFSIVVVTLASVSVYLSTTSNQLRNNIRKITIPALIAIVLGMRQRAGPMSGLTQLFEPLQVLWSTAWEHLWTSLTIGLFTVIVGLALPPSRNWTTATRFSVLGFLFLAYTCQPLLGAFLYWSGFWSQIQAIVVASSPYVTE